VPGSAFEAVDESSLMVNPDSGQARTVAAVRPTARRHATPVAADGGVFSFCEPFTVPGGQHLNAPSWVLAEHRGTVVTGR